MATSMRMRHPTVYMLGRSEEEVICSTLQSYNMFDWRVPIAVEELLRLSYHLGPREPAGTPAAALHAYCSNQYGQIPYTVLSTRDLWRRGQYLEAGLLVRHLLEVFVQMRYFQRYPAKLVKHWTAREPKDFVKFRPMFEDLAPGSYRPLYSLPSTLAHGSGTLLFRMGPIRTDPISGVPSAATLVGSSFNELNAGYVYGYLVSLLLGALNYFPVFFPSNDLAADAEFSSDIESTRDWLNSLFTEAASRAPSTTFFDPMAKLVLP
jgi:hypothetical protein